MKRLKLIILLSTLTATVFAQDSSDSIAYQQQSAKIISMLAKRARKFGQYDRSLKLHTGIFGLQTKNDIRRSNDILMDIIQTDDSVYKQIKILLDFRAFRQTQVRTHSREADGGAFGYSAAVSKLKHQVRLLKAEAEKQQQDAEKTKWLFIVSFMLALAAILLLLTTKRKQIA